MISVEKDGTSTDYRTVSIRYSCETGGNDPAKGIVQFDISHGQFRKGAFEVFRNISELV